MAKNQGEEVVADELEEMGSEPRVYELGFHLDPELPTEEVKKAFQAIRTGLAAAGPVIAEVEPEKIQLAYTISRQEVSGRRDFSSAYFGWVVYETTPTQHADLIKAAAANKAIIRFVDLLTDKDAARHALEVHELMEKAPTPQMDPEEVLSSEVDAALESATI